MPVRFFVPLLYHFLLMRPSTAPVSSVLAVNGVRRRAMSSYRSCGLVLEIRCNTEGTVEIYVYDPDALFVNVTPSKPILQSYQDHGPPTAIVGQLTANSWRAEASSRPAATFDLRSMPRDLGTTPAKFRIRCDLSSVRVSQLSSSPGLS